ncbi:MAG TPA: putative DNA binding domain-containing protein, partial [Candidatus Egerieimonas intestinavium]|nr:putative DNA binding domain-containing protein [Candidatus Egerieimonas intestinavium]
MDSTEILELLKFGERINLECKKAESKLPNSVWETYSSFANTDGGVILFGIEEHLKETDYNKRFSFTS